MEIEFDHPTRGLHYRVANENMQSVRQAEINKMLEKISAKPGETVVDFGAGSGLLSYPLAHVVGKDGSVYVMDSSREVLKKMLTNVSATNIKVIVLDSECIPLDKSSVDVVATLANIHHIADKTKIFLEFSRILKPGGRLVIGDVANNTAVQRYFDGPVNRFCSTGHKHKFLDEAWAKALCKKVGLHLDEWQLEDVPWRFTSKTDAQWFIHAIHDAQCSPEECFQAAESCLGFVKTDEGLELNWQLFYMTSTKPIK